MHNQKLSRYFFIALLLGVAAVFFYMVRVFFIPVLLAAVFATLFYPLYERLLKAFRGRRGLAAIACCLILLLGLIGPLYGVVDLVVREGTSLFETARAQYDEAMLDGSESLPNRIRSWPLARRLGLDRIDLDLDAAVRQAMTSLGPVVSKVFDYTKTTLNIVIVLFVTLFTMFYFFRDGQALVGKLKYLIPLSDEYKTAIIGRFASVARATVKGTLVIALVQGTLAGLTLWICGIESAVLWGVVAVIFSIIPMVGAWLVMYPAAAYQLLTGHIWQGIVIIAVTVVVIVNVDNLLRPRLVGHEAGMHDLVVFFSTLGGIGAFGPMGFIVGPVIAALFLAILDIYSVEFHEQLEELGSAPAQEGEELQEVAHDDQTPPLARTPAETA